MHKVKINLVTGKDLREFVDICSQLPGKIQIVGMDESGEVRVNAKSLLGASYSMIWTDTVCESDKDIYSHIRKFAY